MTSFSQITEVPLSLRLASLVADLQNPDKVDVARQALAELKYPESAEVMEAFQNSSKRVKVLNLLAMAFMLGSFIPAAISKFPDHKLHALPLVFTMTLIALSIPFVLLTKNKERKQFELYEAVMELRDISVLSPLIDTARNFAPSSFSQFGEGLFWEVVIEILERAPQGRLKLRSGAFQSLKYTLELIDKESHPRGWQVRLRAAMNSRLPLEKV